MLDERVTRFVREALRIKALEFDQQLSIQLVQLDGQYLKAGQFQGSGRANAYALAIRQELRNRAQYAFIEVQRALALYPQVLDVATKSFLLGLHITEIRGQCTQLQLMLGKRLGQLGGGAIGQLNDECDHLRDKYTLEIDAFVQAATLRAGQKGEGAGVVIHGSVGVVQTGAFASSTLTLNVGSEDCGAMMKALDLAAATIRDSQQLAEEHRQQTLELVDHLRSASQRPRPNPSLLRGMFIVLCETLQAIAASGPALAAIRAASLPFGIAL